MKESLHLLGFPGTFRLNATVPDRVRKARTHGLPLRIIAHEDVLTFRRPTEPRVQDDHAG